ncbi:MAG: DUF3859 domain-containing protein [Chamaesiphon sp.]|nr:DUF3859 domain-containing protein [Chamaesiphon sp.]
MEQRLTTQQLELIVGEVGRLANRQAEELDRSEIEKILVELNLPPELLDEAMIQVQRKEALVKQKQRTIGMVIASVIALVMIIAGASLFSQSKNSSLAKITASADRITLVQSNEDIQIVKQGSELAYRVTLNDAPVGEKLNLTCNWMDPTSRVIHTNRFETKNITTSVWNTQCRYKVPTSAPTGNWKVQIFVGDRSLEQAPFVVK